MGFLVAERLPATYESVTTLLGPVSGDRETPQASGTQARTITVRARNGEAVRAAEIENSVAGALARYANGKGLATPAEARLTIVERVVPSTNDIGPSEDLILPLAAIAGSTVVTSEEELSAVAPVAVLAFVANRLEHSASQQRTAG